METTASQHAYRASLLIERRRYREALGLVEESLAAFPDDALLHYQRAICLAAMDQPAAALNATEAALALEPNAPDFHALKAQILMQMDKAKPALAAVEEAIRLAPHEAEHHAIRAGVLGAQHKWKEAEAAAREALAIDADNATAATLLSHTLRLQGKSSENAEQIAGMLARDPDDDDNHAAAGWAALQSGNRTQAETHFLEALRLNPHNSFARDGLLESFRSRSPLYRGYLKYVFFMARLTPGMQIGLLIGAYLVARFFGGPVLWIYLAFAFSSHVAPGAGNLIIASDRRARRALHRKELVDGIVVGGLLLLALGLAVVALGLQSTFLALTAGASAALAFPLSKVFLNKSQIGTILFSVLSGLALLCFLYFGVLHLAAGDDATSGMRVVGFGTWLVGVLICGASTFLSLIPALSRRE